MLFFCLKCFYYLLRQWTGAMILNFLHPNFLFCFFVDAMVTGHVDSSSPPFYRFMF